MPELDVARTQAIIDGVRIPEQPQALLDLRREISRESPDIARVAECIEHDVGLAAMVLQTVNSPFFGSLIEIHSLRHATVMLGLQNISNVVAGLAMRRALETADGSSPANFWESPANVALVSARLAKHFRVATADEAYMLGLFRDCGEALLAQRFSDYFDTVRQARATLEDGCRYTAAEDDRFDTNHAVVSYLVSRSWGLPDVMGKVILDHHQACLRFAIADGETSDELDLLAILKFAEHVDNLFWDAPAPEWSVLREPVANYLGISGPDLDELEADLLEMLVTGE